MANTDVFGFNNTEMFAKIRDGLPALREHTQNLLECKDDLLYAWNEAEKCLLVINWRSAQLKDAAGSKYQTLTPAVPQHFKVERIVVSHEGSLIALAGPHGITILEVPRRWGSSGLFMEGKDKITCRATNLDTLFFANNSHLQMRQLRWHPASPNDDHLLALFSDNTLRVYDNATLRHVWQVGPILTPRNDATHLNSLEITAQGLGEIVVDFDIAPPVKTSDGSILQNDKELSLSSKQSTNTINNTMVSPRSPNTSAVLLKTKPKLERVEWPIVVLRENGNIYVLMAGLDTEKPRLQGPLTITPQSRDNYGLDSCAILVMPSLPVTLVIAESTGKLHHAIMLETENAEESLNDSDAGLRMYPCEWFVHVLETVELELGLPAPDSPAFNCAIHMKRDYINELRYFAYHGAGLHVVTLNFIKEIKRYANNEVSSDVSGLATPSRAEYLLCTRIDLRNNANAVLGFVQFQMPSAIVLLLASGQIISLKVAIDAQFLNAIDPEDIGGDGIVVGRTTKTDSDKLLEQILETNFVDLIKNTLKPDVTQPILSVDKTTILKPQECYQVLQQAIEVFRTQYITRHNAARVEMIRKVNTLLLQRDQQLRDIEYLEQSRNEISEIAHRQAERFEELKDHQEALTKRCMDLVRTANTSLPVNTTAETEFSKEVKRSNDATKKLSIQLDNVRETMKRHQYHISEYNKTHKIDKSIELPAKEERVLKEILAEMTIEIEQQVKETKIIRDLICG